MVTYTRSVSVLAQPLLADSFVCYDKLQSSMTLTVAFTLAAAAAVVQRLEARQRVL
jgi:hypothetical protein